MRNRFCSRRFSHRKRAALCEALEKRTFLSANVLANHNDPGSTGQDLSETVLTPATVGSTQAGSSISTNFGRLFDTTLDGQVYAQPLAVANVNITRGSSQGIHNVLYVATMHDSLYAVDANTGVILWQDSFLQITDPRVNTIGSPVVTPGATTLPAVSGNNALISPNDVGPELGILATPAINPAGSVIYLVTDSRELRNGTTPSATGADIHWVQRIWALSTSDGSVAITPTLPAGVATSGGQTIADTIKNDTISSSNYKNYKYVAGPFIKGTGNNSDTFNGNGSVATTDNADGWVVNTSDPGTIFAGTTPSAAGYIAFNGLLQMNRVATTLINGEIYLGFASHGDDGPYYGWLLGYSGSTLTNNAAFVTVPTFDGVKGSAGFTSVGGLWASGGGITTDGTYLYFTVGNGSFNNATSNFNSNYFSLDGTHHVLNPLDGDYGDSVLKVAFDLSATQTNINLKNDAAGAPTPDGTYNPDGGYNQVGYGLKVVDFFTPSNVRVLNIHDEDIGSGGVMLIPTTGGGAATAPDGDQMLVTMGKEGRIYLIDAGNMGGFNTQYVTDGHDQDVTTATADPAPYDRVLGEYYYRQANGNPSIFANDQTDKGYSIPGYFNGDFYVGLGGNSTTSLISPEQGFALANFPFSATPHTGIQPSPNFITSNKFGGRGTTPSFSANGTSNGIVWDTDVTFTMVYATLSTALTSGHTNITTLAISPLANSLSNGNTIVLNNPGTSNTQTVTALNVVGTLTTALTSGQTGVTTLHVTALSQAVTSGSTITLRAGSSSQSVTLSSAASSGATTISVNSFTANAAYAIGSTVDTSGTIAVGTTSLHVISFTANSAYPTGSVVTKTGDVEDYLVAYDTSGNMLFNSDWKISGAANNLGDMLTNGVPGATGPKFGIPTIFNGMVYVGTGGGSSTANSHALGTITAYGLLSTQLTSGTFAAPTGLATSAASTTDNHLTWTRHSALETEMEIDRSADGANWSVLQYVPNGTTSYDDIVPAGSNFFYRVRAIAGSSVTTYSYALIVNSGTFTFSSDPAASTPSLAITDNATLSFAAPVGGSGINNRTVASLTLGNDAMVTLHSAASPSDRLLLVLGSLGFPGNSSNWGATLDMGANDLIVQGAGATGLTHAFQQLTSGFAAGLGYWNGSNGIISTAAATNGAHLTTLGVMQNVGGLAFDGHSSGTNDILVKYTDYGDADLTGTLNGADYHQIDMGFGLGFSGWSNGDFNYDSVVNGSDYALIDNAFNQLTVASAVMVPDAQPLAVMQYRVALANPFRDGGSSSTDEILDLWKSGSGGMDLVEAANGEL